MLEGLMCYDRWINDFKAPEKKRDVGDAYCYGIYRSTHKAAAGFLHELVPKYPQARPELQAAARYFDAEANVLAKSEDILWWNAPEGPDAERNTQVVQALAKARQHYAHAIGMIEEALALIEQG
jgi:hypothetical protein